MNKQEKQLYATITGGKAKSRRSIRRNTTGAERSSVKTLLKKQFFDNYVPPAPVILPEPEPKPKRELKVPYGLPGGRECDKV